MIVAMIVAISFYEFICAARLVIQFSDHGDVEDFIANAPLWAIIRVRFHVVTSMTMFQMATIVSILHGSKQI